MSKYLIKKGEISQDWLSSIYHFNVVLFLRRKNLKNSIKND